MSRLCGVSYLAALGLFALGPGFVRAPRALPSLPWPCLSEDVVGPCPCLGAGLPFSTALSGCGFLFAMNALVLRHFIIVCACDPGIMNFLLNQVLNSYFRRRFSFHARCSENRPRPARYMMQKHVNCPLQLQHAWSLGSWAHRSMTLFCAKVRAV